MATDLRASMGLIIAGARGRKYDRARAASTISIAATRRSTPSCRGSARESSARKNNAAARFSSRRRRSSKNSWRRCWRDAAATAPTSIRQSSTIIADGPQARRSRADRSDRKFDRVQLTPATLRVTPAETPFGAQSDSRRAIAARWSSPPRRIADVPSPHRSEESFIYRDKSGMRLGQMVRPLRRVGIYVPGGLGAYPSSVLMNAIPAQGRGRRAKS